MHRSSSFSRIRAPRSIRARIGAGVIAAAVAGGAVAVWPSAGRGPAPVTLSAAGCGDGWSVPHSGVTRFSVHNATHTVDDVVLERSDQRVVAEIPTLAPGVIRPIRVALEPGTYSWRCVSTDGEITISDSRRVSGPRVADPSPGYQPVISDDLTTAADNYRAQVTSGLAVLATDTDHLTDAVVAGRLPEAETAWLVAHLDYERLGAAYGSFGPFDDEINGRPDGLVGGVTSPQFTGFHRLEYGLWHGQPQAALAGFAQQLDGFVHGLVAAWPHQLLAVTDVPLRAHEILENALQFELTGDTDEGSQSDLATVRANVDGTNIVLDALAPLLEQRDPTLLVGARGQLGRLADLLDSYHQPTGAWAPLGSLAAGQREQLDGALDATLASLDQVPAQLEQASGDNA